MNNREIKADPRIADSLPGAKSDRNIIAYLAIMFIVACIAVSGIFVYRANAADQTYNVLNNLPKNLLDMGDGTYSELAVGRTQYQAFYASAGVSATTYFMLLDLSDTTNYPHTETDDLIITSADIGVVANGTQWEIFLGVVTDITANTVTMKYFCTASADVVTYSVGKQIDVPSSGMNTDNIASADIADTALTTGTTLVGPFGNTNAEVGDIVILVNEASGSATTRFLSAVTYWTK
jgi:hypothetical protein